MPPPERRAKLLEEDSAPCGEVKTLSSPFASPISSWPKIATLPDFVVQV